MGKEYTNIYVSLKKEDDVFIDNLRVDKIKKDKKHYTKNDVVKHLIHLGMDVENGRYIAVDPNIDIFVAQLQDMVIEYNGQRTTIKKTKQQVYTMLIEKGLLNLSSEQQNEG